MPSFHPYIPKEAYEYHNVDIYVMETSIAHGVGTSNASHNCLIYNKHGFNLIMYVCTQTCCSKIEMYTEKISVEWFMTAMHIAVYRYVCTYI